MNPFQKIVFTSRRVFSLMRGIHTPFKEAQNLNLNINTWTLSFKTYVLSILILLTFSAGLYAQGNNIKFDHISIEQGLSQSTVSCIIQDKRGFMWFGTEDGLNKYDGYNFTVYKNDPLDSTSLSDSYVLSIYEDRSGMLWIGTYGGGLNKFDREKEQFVHYEYDPNSRYSLSSNMVFSIYEDRSGVLWVGTEKGLNKFDREKAQFTHYRCDAENPNSLSNDSIRSIFEDREGMLWIGTDQGLNRFDREKRKFTCCVNEPGVSLSLSNNRVNSIYEDKSGVLWVGTEGGLNRFNRKKEKFTYWINEPGNSRSSDNNHVRSIYEDKFGILWIGTYGSGLIRFDKAKERFEHCLNEPGNPLSLNNNNILSIYEDRAGVLWIGTYGGGVNRYDRERGQFKHWVSEPGNPNSLSHNMILSVFEDKSGVLWIGTDGGGLNRFDRKKGEFTHWLHEPGNSNSLSSNRVRAIYEDSSGLLWVGTYEGLNKFDRKKEKFRRYRHDPNNPNSLNHDYVRSIYEDENGVLWIGTYGGLNKFDREKERFTYYIHDPNNPQSLSDDHVVSIHEDKAGMLWIGTAEGLNRFDREKEQFRHWVNDPGNPDSLSNNRVLSIYEDKSGVLWIGTYGGGLNRFDREKGRFIHYRERDGLPNDVIYGILEDNRGNLWLSTNKGLSRFDPQKKNFRNYDVNDGLQSDEFNSGAYHKSKSGEMFFGGINGINAFYPENIRDNPYIPAVVITNFQLFNESVPIGKGIDGHVILEKSITETEEIRLSYKDRVFSFEFAALHFVSPEKNQYAYMMEGLEKHWNYVENRRFATYTHLAPGEYIFRVKGSNSDGLWNKEGTSLKIIVTPPFWQTWWFRSLAAAAVLFLFVMIYQIKTRTITQRAKQLEKQVKERTSELKESEVFLQSVFDGIQDGISVLDRDLNIIQVNQWIEKKYAAEMPLVGKKCYSVYQRRKTPCSYCPSVPSMEISKTHTTVVPYPLLERPTGWIELTSFPRKDADGHLAGVIEYAKDITERKRAENKLNTSLKEKEVLLKEIHHRVKNNMQIISSLLNLQSSYIKDDKALDIFKKSRDRIRSMALIHEKLYGSDDLASIDFAQYIQDLIVHLLHSYRIDTNSIKATIEVKDVFLDINTAIPCGLIINELVSNSFKHAFHNGRVPAEGGESKREIWINFYSDKNGLFTLVVGDNGMGLPKNMDFRKTESLGLQLVNDLVRQVEGSIELLGDTGTAYKITFKTSE